MYQLILVFITKQGHTASFQVDPFSESRSVESLEVTVQIPDDIPARMTVASGDLSQRALEALAAEEYRNGNIHKPDLRRLFAFETSYEIDGFLKAHNVYDEYTLDDFDAERNALREA